MREGGPSGLDGTKQAPTQEVFHREAERGQLNMDTPITR